MNIVIKSDWKLFSRAPGPTSREPPLPSPACGPAAPAASGHPQYLLWPVSSGQKGLRRPEAEYLDNVLRYRNTPLTCCSLTSTRSCPISRSSWRSYKTRSSCWAMPWAPSIWTCKQTASETRLMRPLIKKRVIMTPPSLNILCFPWRRLFLISFLLFLCESVNNWKQW